ncbi:hypothetical protein L1266_18675 [Pseudoalteromonas sp. Cn5-37]|uniref:hypothetical protein n=1 Tax=Pseudoalteromonas sp. Cn5-37 TaxID=2908886 RepID=UPI001F35D5CB|nr:hypothetical protein [Pseudoalteromonas sp. Cn5-37]MCF2918206.1 hypothetical protein [Pseudoalteromonas sp. Cn5-37]
MHSNEFKKKKKSSSHAEPNRKNGRIIFKNSSQIKIKSSSGIFTTLRKDVKKQSWDKLRVDLNVWFSVKNNEDAQVMRASSISIMPKP